MPSRFLPLVVVALIVLSCGTLFAQGGWTVQDSTTAPHNLLDICFIDSLNGWASGDSGTIMRTTDGGRHWSLLPPPTDEAIPKIKFTPTGIGYAICGAIPRENGIYGTMLLKTTNSGISWDTLLFSLPYSINNIAVVGPETMLVSLAHDTGSYSYENDSIIILLTQNAGRSFTRVFTDTVHQYHCAIATPKPNLWYAVDWNGIYSSRNYGVSWEWYPMEGWYYLALPQIFTCSNGDASVMNDGDVYWVTNDEGTSWNRVRYESIASINVAKDGSGWRSDKFFASWPEYAYYDTLFRTTDCGQNWVPIAGCVETETTSCPPIVSSFPRGIFTYNIHHTWGFGGSNIYYIRSQSFSLYRGWNLVSWPVLPDPPTISAQFPHALAAWVYDPGTGRYTVADTVRPEQGFWILCGRDTTIELHGQPIDTLRFTTNGGWLLMGNTTAGAFRDSIITYPSELLVPTSFYVYDPASGYRTIGAGERIPQGKGCWILSEGMGTVRVR